MVSLSSLNPLSNFDIGSLGLGLLIFFGSLFVVGMIGVAVYLYLEHKKLKYTIPLYKKIGNNLVRVAILKAKDFKIGHAGDVLWYVPKAKKYIPAGVIQTAPNEYSHFEREDGEWINIGLPDIDTIMKQFGVKYIQSDMRSSRISIGNILEQRFKGKESWWQKYGHMVTEIIFFLVIAVAMVVIFYQWSQIADKIGALFDKVVAYEQMKCPSPQGVVPAFILLTIKRKWTH